MASSYRRIKLLVVGVLCCGLMMGCTQSNGLSTSGQEGSKDTKIANEYEKAEGMSNSQKQAIFDDGNTTYVFQTSGKKFQKYDGEQFEDFYSQGVNIGAGKPNYFPGELGITEEEYEEWFEYIGEMNANTIRVYTVMMPSFYNAFYNYNETHDKKIYLYQGCWYDEDVIVQSNDVYDIYDSVKKEIKDLTDIIHGNANIEKRIGHGYGIYWRDISPYVAGWILGIESDAALVGGTNDLHPDKTGFEGEYLTCKEVSPFENFWCEIGDYILKYEDENYHMQRPISFTNWVTTDVMEHPNEPLAREDAVSLTVAHLKAGEKFKAGIFASYHVYPYYPNFMFSEEPYMSYVDDDGKVNPYKCYLEDLVSHYDYPVLVAEFGIPSSRGVTHVNPITGFNQGGVSEEDQGKMLVSMFEDIKEVGCMGGLVFTWQDEWFKRTWNTMDYTNGDRRAYWNDVQTCEQHFGLMGFMSKENAPTPIIDGEDQEWKEENLVLTSGSTKLYAKSDSTYLYLMLRAPEADYDHEGTEIYFEINPEIGSTTYDQIALSKPADYILKINGMQETRFLVEEKSDNYHYIFGKQDEASIKVFEGEHNAFQPIYLITDRSLLYPQTQITVPVQKVETGLLRFGITDMKKENYDSLADFCYKGEVFEIRIPWGLLGFSDPSQKEINAFYKEEGEAGRFCIDDIGIGVINGTMDIGCGQYSWKNWNEAEYEAYLRRSYDILKDYLSKK